MPFTSPFACNFVEEVPLLFDYLLVVEHIYPELPRDELPPRDLLLAAVQAVHVGRMADLFEYSGQVMDWAGRAFALAVEYHGTPHIPITPAITRVSERVMMDMSLLTAFEFERYQRDLEFVYLLYV